MSRNTPFPLTQKIKYEIVKASRDTGNSPFGHRGKAQLKSLSVTCNVQNFKIMILRRRYQSESGLAQLSAMPALRSVI